MTDTEDFFAQFADELNDPKVLSLEEVQRAMPVHGDTRATMIARNNRNSPKRLTNAELAAEYESARCDALLVQETGHYWQSIECTWSQDTERVHERERTLIRFATLPHYDEVTE